MSNTRLFLLMAAILGVDNVTEPLEDSMFGFGNKKKVSMFLQFPTLGRASTLDARARDHIPPQKTPEVVVKSREVHWKEFDSRTGQWENKSEMRAQVIVPHFGPPEGLTGKQRKRWLKRHPKGLRLGWESPNYWLDRPDLTCNMGAVVKANRGPVPYEQRLSRKLSAAAWKGVEKRLNEATV